MAATLPDVVPVPTNSSTVGVYAPATFVTAPGLAPAAEVVTAAAGLVAAVVLAAAAVLDAAAVLVTAAAFAAATSATDGAVWCWDADQFDEPQPVEMIRASKPTETVRERDTRTRRAR
jgi:hypothetical protein